MDRTVARAACAPLAALAIVLAASAPAPAQDRPFLFSITTAAPTTTPLFRIDYDVGAGERAFQSDTENQPEQRVGVQVSQGRLTFIGQFGVSQSGSSYQSSQDGEVLYSVLGAPRGRIVFAAGGGVQHEAGGANVLVARVVTGHETDTWRVDGNLLLEHPMAPNRDAVDLITTVGWARKLTPAVALGVEGIGEDLEGFWDPTEAEGGARILVGPSLHLTPDGRKWQFTAAGGPTFHPDSSSLASDALRDLPPTTKRLGYALRVGLTYKVF